MEGQECLLDKHFSNDSSLVKMARGLVEGHASIIHNRIENPTFLTPHVGSIRLEVTLLWSLLYCTFVCSWNGG